MILDTLKNAARYEPLHSGFRAGFDFLRRVDLARLADGRHELEGERLFALVARAAGRGPADSPLESHCRYIDIQYVIEGSELIGWLPTAACRRPTGPFDEQRDIGFFHDSPATWLAIPVGGFAVFYPHDAHAPLAGGEAVHKVVIKVAVEW
jgi:YhcH/YjgK/YiaL family protein